MLRKSNSNLGASLLNKDGEVYDPKGLDDDPIEQGYIYYDPNDIDPFTGKRLDDSNEEVVCYRGDQKLKRYRVHYKKSMRRLYDRCSWRREEFVEPETKDLISKSGAKLEEDKFFKLRPLRSFSPVPESIMSETNRYEIAKTREEFYAMFLMDLVSVLIYGQFPDRFVGNRIGILNFPC